MENLKFPNIKQLASLKEDLAPGHRLCAGCGASIVFRQLTLVAKYYGYKLVFVNATGCLEVCTSIYPYTSWKTSWIHSAFENAAATASGIEAALKVLKKKGIINKDEKIKVVAIGGDGGTYDIGLQSLSGALERRHDFIYICYDNEAYMNTGIQRSGATPTYANTTTEPVGKVKPGKDEPRKNLTEIAAAHDIPYVAQTTPAHFNDIIRKFAKALFTKGPAFLNIFSICPRGWRYKEEIGFDIARLAVDTCYWPLYEVINGKYVINYKPRNKKSIEEFLKLQGRFKHLFAPQNKHLIEKLQKMVDRNWEKLLAKEEATKNL